MFIGVKSHIGAGEIYWKLRLEIQTCRLGLWWGSRCRSSRYSWTFPAAAAAARFSSKAVKQRQIAINTFDENKLGARNITDRKHNSRQWNHIRRDATRRRK